MYMILTVHFFCWWLSAVNRFIRDWSTVQILLPRMKRGDLPISGRSKPAEEKKRFSSCGSGSGSGSGRSGCLSLICQIKSRWTIAHQSVKNELSCLFQAPIIDERTHRLVSRVTHRNILGFLVRGLAICNVTFWEFVLAWVTGHASLMYPIRYLRTRESVNLTPQCLRELEYSSSLSTDR